MTLTQENAKTLTLEKCRQFAEMRPADRKFQYLPESIRAKLCTCHNHCALCELYISNDPPYCPGCPLDGLNCGDVGFGNLERLIDLVEAWK